MYILNMRTYYRDVNRIVFKSQHLQTQNINTTNAMLIQQEILHIYLSLNPEHETSFFIWLKQPQLGLGLLIFEVSRSHRVTPHAHTQTHTHTHPVRLLLTSDQLYSDSSTCTNKQPQEEQPCLQRDLNPRPQQSSGCRPLSRKCMLSIMQNFQK